jgi:uncharacterized protein
MSVRPSDAADTLRARARARTERAKARAARLTARLPAARAALDRAGAKEVWLFGSLATGAVRETSDVDLAASGLPPEHFFDALAELMELFVAPVDLVRLEDAPDSLRRRILEEGRRL